MKKEERELIHLLRSNPDEGIRTCIERYGGSVKAICQNILRDKYSDLAEDAMAETFICLWQDLTSKKKIQNTLQGYVYGIARNQALQILRKNRRQKETGKRLEEKRCFL